MTDAILTYIQANWVQVLITIAVGVTYFLLDRLSTPLIEEGADQGHFRSTAVDNAVVIARAITALFGSLVLVIVWGVDLGSLLVFATTAITLLGVALFASWSILSNITAFFILLVHPSFKRRNFVRVIDVDNYVEGYIADVTLFNTQLITENREVIVYPNNLILGRPTMINPRNRLNGVGKITAEKPMDKPGH